MSCRRILVGGAGLIAAFAVALGPADSASAEPDPGTFSGGDAVKTGWWWQAKDTDARSAGVAEPDVSPPNVPEGALPVAAVNGETEKLSAIEFALDAAPGSRIDSFLLALKESEEPGANLNHEEATVVACAVTELFWVAEDAADWSARPEHDCERGRAEGQRGEDGVWVFDLTSLAADWLSENSLEPTSIVLVDDSEAPDSFQVAYDGLGADGVGVELVTTAPEPTVAPPPDNPAPVDDSGGSVPETTSDTSPPEPLDAPAPAPLDAAVEEPVETSTTDDAPTDEPVESTPATESDDSSQQAIARTGQGGPPPWYSGIPTLGLLLALLALGLAYLALIALGPDAQPTPTTAQHGVGRALERLRRLGGTHGFRGSA